MIDEGRLYLCRIMRTFLPGQRESLQIDNNVMRLVYYRQIKGLTERQPFLSRV